MKRFLAFALVLAFCIPLTACQQTERKGQNYFIEEDFEGKAVGVIENSGLVESVKDNLSKSDVKVFNSVKKAIKALKAHKVETVVLRAYDANNLLANDSSLGTIMEIYIDKKRNILSTKEGATAEGEFHRDIEATLSRLKGDGSYDKLLDKYFSGEYPKGNAAKIDFHTTTIEREFVFGVVSNAPYAYKTESGEWAGFDIEIANAVCERGNATPIFKEYADKTQLLEALKNDEIRVALGQFTTNEAEKQTHPIYPTEYIDDSSYFIVNKADVGKNPFVAVK